MNAQAWFARHAQVLVGALGRLVQQPLASVMTTSVIGVALALPLLLGVLLENCRTATADWNQALELSVYLQKRAPTSRAEAFARQLRGRSDVAAVKVISAETALAQFRITSDFGVALDALGDNPLPDTLMVTPTVAASTPEGLAALRSMIAAAPDVQSVQADTEWVKRLHAIMEMLRRVVWLTAAILGAGVVLVIGNTIRLDILNRRSEIEVMKLVGATNAFARRPFLYAGVLYGLGGGVLAVILVMVALLLMTAPVQRLADLYESRFHLNGLGVGATAKVLFLATVLGWSGSWLASARHIRAIEPA